MKNALDEMLAGQKYIILQVEILRLFDQILIMEQIYYLIIIGALLLEYCLSTTVQSLKYFIFIISILTVPKNFQDYYDENKYAKSQSYLKDKTKLGLPFSNTFGI